MVNVRKRDKGVNLLFDFRYLGHRCREQTMLPDSKENRAKLEVVAKKIEASINAKVKEIIVEELGVEGTEVTLEANFIEDLGADSLDTVELIMKFEEEFDIDIPDEEAEKLTTVGKAVDYLKTKVN